MKENDIPLATARRYAAKVVRTLRPYCLKIKVAGSVRRHVAVVHDIDIVLMAKDEAAYEAIKARCSQKAEVLRNGGSHFAVITPAGITLELYFARGPVAELWGELPTNWGTMLVCRTGSKEHNCRMALAAKAQGMHWDPYAGLSQDGRIVAAATERDLYRALGWPWKRPEQRQ